VSARPPRALFVGPDWRAAPLSPERDAARAQAVLDAAADYAEFECGAPAPPDAGAAFFTDAPPRKPDAEMLKLGIEAAGLGLAGLLDVVLDYPAPPVWFIGLLLLRPEARGRGLGRAAAEGLAEHAAARGARALRLVALERNARGRAFWEARGFRPLRRLPPERFGTRTHVRVEYERPLA